MNGMKIHTQKNPLFMKILMIYQRAVLSRVVLTKKTEKTENEYEN
jgi:hypothetical protein